MTALRDTTENPGYRNTDVAFVHYCEVHNDPESMGGFSFCSGGQSKPPWRVRFRYGALLLVIGPRILYRNQNAMMLGTIGPATWQCVLLGGLPLLSCVRPASLPTGKCGNIGMTPLTSLASN